MNINRCIEKLNKISIQKGKCDNLLDFLAQQPYSGTVVNQQTLHKFLKYTLDTINFQNEGAE